MLASIIIPAFKAEATIARAVRGALGQTHRDVEVILVSDDGRDYLAFLAAQGITDARLRQVSTGKHGGGAHLARNLGLTQARGDFITHFDADDVMRPRKLELLIPLAQTKGAAFDPVDVVDDTSEQLIYTALAGTSEVDMDVVFDSGTPLIPLMRRDCAWPRVEGIELADDVVANVMLVDRLGPLPVHGEALCEYRVVTQSMSHLGNSAARYDEHYALILTMLPLIPLSQSNRPRIHRGFVEKRALNQAYGEAAAKRPGLTFQHFIAERLQAAEQR